MKEQQKKKNLKARESKTTLCVWNKIGKINNGSSGKTENQAPEATSRLLNLKSISVSVPESSFFNESRNIFLSHFAQHA